MKSTLSMLVLLGAMWIVPAALSDASVSSAGAQVATCEGPCDLCGPGSCPVPCGSTCALAE